MSFHLCELPLTRLKKIIFMYDNAPSHDAKTTTEFLTLLGFVTKIPMVWPLNPPDLNSIENLHVVDNKPPCLCQWHGKQYSLKDGLWNVDGH